MKREVTTKTKECRVVIGCMVYKIKRECTQFGKSKITWRAMGYNFKK